MAREAVIHQVQPYDLHGVRWYALAFAYRDDPDVVREARLAHDAIYPDPRPGDFVLVESVLNMVMEIKKQIDRPA